MKPQNHKPLNYSLQMQKENNLLLYSNDKNLQKTVLEMERYFSKIIISDPSAPLPNQADVPLNFIRIVDLDNQNIKADCLLESPGIESIYITKEKTIRSVFNIKFILMKPIKGIDLLKKILYIYINDENVDSEHYEKKNYICNTQKHILIKSEEITEIVPFDDITYFKSVGKSTEIHKTDGKTVISNMILKESEKDLPKKIFLRINNTIIVNISVIERILRREGYEAILASGERLPLSKVGYEEIMKYYNA